MTSKAHVNVRVHDIIELRPPFIHARLHRLVPGRSWVLVGKVSGRVWLRFLFHRDQMTLCVEDGNGNGVVAVERLSVLATWLVCDCRAKWSGLVESKHGQWE